MAPDPRPPVAKKVKHEMELFGDVRKDDYYWLRDDSRTNTEVLDYLKAENEYTDLMMAGELSIPSPFVISVTVWVSGVLSLGFLMFSIK